MPLRPSAVLTFVALILGNFLIIDSIRHNLITLYAAKSFVHQSHIYPENLPIQLASHEVDFGSDRFYNINSTHPVTSAEWESHFQIPGGLLIRLGPNKRILSPAMLHRLHCIGMFNRALRAPRDQLRDQTTEHLQHCLVYLQQFTLCDADTTLEPGDFTQPTPPGSRSYTRECRDWSTVWEYMQAQGDVYRELLDRYESR